MLRCLPSVVTLGLCVVGLILVMLIMPGVSDNVVTTYDDDDDEDYESTADEFMDLIM